MRTAEMFQFTQLVRSLRETYARASSEIETGRDIRNLNSLGTRHRESLRAMKSPEAKPRSFEESMTSRRAEVRVEVRHILREAKRRLTGARRQ